MIVGIISDSHDNLPKLQKAISLFNKKNVSLVLHAGDFIAPFAVGMMEKHLSCEYFGVFGNNDGERNGLNKISKGKINTDVLDFEKLGKKILLIHDIEKLNKNLSGYNIVISGHTHVIDINKKDDTWFINPGECGGWLKGKSSVVTLDLISDTPRVHRL